MSDTKKICIVCGESLPYPWLLIKHFETHKNPDGQPHMCPECKLPFSTNESFLIHLSRIHCDHNIPEYKCSKCNRRFMSEYARDHHKKRKHGSARTDTTPTLTANVTLKHQSSDDCLYASKRSSNPLEGSVINTVTDRIEHPFGVEMLNPNMPFNPFWETKHHLISPERSSESSVLSRYDAFIDAFFRGLSGNKNPPAIGQSVRGQYPGKKLQSSTHSRHAAFNDASFSLVTRNQNAPVISQVQGQQSEQNLHSVGRSSLPASSNSNAIRHPQCRAPKDNHISIIKQAHRQNALPISLLQGPNALTQVSTAEPFGGQVFPSSSSASQTQVIIGQNLGTSSTTSESEQRNEGMQTGMAEHGNPYNASHGLPFYEMDKRVQPFQQIQPQTMGHNFLLGEHSVEADSKIQALYNQPFILPANETRSTVGAAFDSEIPRDEWEKSVFNSSFCSLLDEPYASSLVKNIGTKPLNNQENMQQSRGPNTLLNSWTQGQVRESHLPSAGPSFQNVDISSGFQYHTQEASFSTSMPLQNDEVTEGGNADSEIRIADLSSTLELSFLDDIQIAQPLDQTQPETVDNCHWNSTQLSHASQTDQNFQQTPATRTTSADTDTGRYGIIEQSNSSPNVTSVNFHAIHDPLKECQNRFDGNSARVLTELSNRFQNEKRLMATAVTEDSPPAFPERPPHQKFCKQCNKFFSTNRSLNDHNMRFHSGVTGKPFQCHICPKKFITKRDVERHVIHAHYDIRPYNCPWCKYKCKTEANLRSHLETHAENRERFKCSICGREYSRKSDLNRHLKRRHGSLNIEGNTKSDSSQNVSNACVIEEQNRSEASGGIVGAAPGIVSRKIYHSVWGGHVTNDHSRMGPEPWTENRV